jgi:hypothetical protein
VEISETDELNTIFIRLADRKLREKPKRLSTDCDPLFRFHRWLANLRVLEIEEIKSVAYTPVSHPFVERLIGTIRREYLDRVFFWNVVDLVRKLREFAVYYNGALNGGTPSERCAQAAPEVQDGFSRNLGDPAFDQ